MDIATYQNVLLREASKQKRVPQVQLLKQLLQLHQGRQQEQLLRSPLLSKQLRLQQGSE